jgi:hypothetical protein
MLAHGEGKQQVVDLALARRAPGHDLEVGPRDVAVVTRLQQVAAGDAPERHA